MKAKWALWTAKATLIIGLYLSKDLPIDNHYQNLYKQGLRKILITFGVTTGIRVTEMKHLLLFHK